MVLDRTDPPGGRLLPGLSRAVPLVLIVEGMTDGTQDKALPGRLQGKVPDGTEVVVNRVAGSRREIGPVQ
jgi:hypothetical protein